MPQQQQRITQLPGENGFHARDGSLTKKKQQQWEKEKAESERGSWFLFGRRSLLSGKRPKKVDKQQQQKEHEQTEEKETNEQNGANSCYLMASSTTPTATGSDFCNNNNNSPMSMHSHQPPPMDQQQPPTIPMLPCQSVEENGFHSPAVLLNYAAPPPSSAHQQQLVPLLLDFPAPTSFYPMSSHFPLQTMAGHQQFAAAFGPSFSPMPFSAFPPTSAFLDPLFLPAQHKVVAPFPMPFSTPPVSGSSSSGSANSPPKERQRQQSEDVEQHREAAFAFHSPAAEQYEPKKTQVRWQQDLDRQMVERRLAEQLEAEQQAQAQRTLEREEAEMARRAEEQRAAEERRRTHKIEIRDQCEQSCLDGLQRAQREAELLRRAKLFRHILLDGQADLETARKVLKAEGEDRQLVGQVLKQLRDLELQRRLSTDSKGSSSPHPSKSPKTATPPRAKEAGTAPSAGGNFCRANSWSVKQPRTLPSHSLLPVPVRQKLHQRTRAENGCPDPANHRQMSTHTQSATGQGLAARRTGASAPVPLPIKSTVDNNNKSVADERKNNMANSRQIMNRPTPPPGLFEQLTLRRPRRSSLGATDMTALLDEQQDNGDHHSPAHGNLNGQSPADKSKAISSSNGSANCHRDQRQANGGDGSRNPSSSVASSTQPNSPGSSSLESSSVVKFRALLLSPAGSQEDLAADLPPPTPISIFRKPNLPAARNGGPLLMPPSPFSRKNSTNTKDGNNGQQQDCFGDGELRRSLRSPTMRRLQDSLQSLATVDGHGGGEGTSGGESRGGTPKPFNCRSSQYRSFNLRRETARQKQILEHLATVRAQLKNSQAQLERTISKQNLAATEADGDVHL